MSVDFFPEKGSSELDLNVANDNAHIPVAMLGAEYHDYGIPVAKLGEALAKVIAVSPSSFVRDTIEPKTTGARLVLCGVTEEQAARYQRSLVKLLKFCIYKQTSLCWG